MKPALLSLRDATFTIGTLELFKGISLHIYERDRLCIVGQNGCGKSTLLKILSGLLHPTNTTCFLQPGVRVAYLPQELPPLENKTVEEFLQESLPEGEESSILSRLLEPLQLEPTMRLNAMSGGQLRRASLAKALVLGAEILLLDEPTNHVDLQGILWMESVLKGWKGAVVCISHDRWFLRAFAKSTLWLANGVLRRMDAPFEKFEGWQETILEEETKQAQRLDTKLAGELEWLHRGVTARRRRNQGRLHKLHALRSQKAALLRKTKGGYNASTVMGESSHLSARLLALEGVHYLLPKTQKLLFTHLDLMVMRTDRVGIVGPNGSGKSTLLSLMEGSRLPTKGSITRSAGLKIGRFYQDYRFHDDTLTPWQLLCETGGDCVQVGGKSRHVMAYLRDFLFNDDQARTPLKALSGGERNRLLLAKLFTQPMELLMLDEPTNDLDADTLDLLEELIASFKGAVVLVSHDRDFLDKTTTSIVGLDGKGNALEFVGGFTEYWKNQQQVWSIAPTTKSMGKNLTPSSPKEEKVTKRLSYKEQYVLKTFPEKVTSLEQKIRVLESALQDISFGTGNAMHIHRLSQELAEAMQERSEAETLWLELSLREDSERNS